jgi:two-component system chemotaxis response regulator CheY
MPRALVVDDSTLVRTKVAHALTDADFTVDAAKDGAEAYAKFLESSFDLVITDILMPVSNGLELLKRVRHLNSRVPVIVLSSASDRQIVDQARSLGASGYLLKPFDAETLLKKIWTVMRLGASCP